MQENDTIPDMFEFSTMDLDGSFSPLQDNDDTHVANTPSEVDTTHVDLQQQHQPTQPNTSVEDSDLSQSITNRDSIPPQTRPMVNQEQTIESTIITPSNDTVVKQPSQHSDY